MISNTPKYLNLEIYEACGINLFLHAEILFDFNYI